VEQLTVRGVRREEVLRYLGYGGAAPDEGTVALIDKCEEVLRSAMRFRHVERCFPISVTGSCVEIANFSVDSGALARHLEGCDSAYLFAATLGAEVDRAMARFGDTEIASAAVFQAVAAAGLEACCDAVCSELAGRFGGGNGNGRGDDDRDGGAAALYCSGFLRPRFSPGYGDFSLEVQDLILRALDAPKYIGLSVTSHNMLTPTKSITAVIGVGRESTYSANRCDGGDCDIKGCAFRKGREASIEGDGYANT
jgi:hypothetical protein